MFKKLCQFLQARTWLEMCNYYTKTNPICKLCQYYQKHCRCPVTNVSTTAGRQAAGARRARRARAAWRHRRAGTWGAGPAPACTWTSAPSRRWCRRCGPATLAPGDGWQVYVCLLVMLWIFANIRIFLHVLAFAKAIFLRMSCEYWISRNKNLKLY